MALPSPSQLKRPSTPSALGFGIEFAQASVSVCETGIAPPTPTNSSRRDSNGLRLMLPRSSRSMRQLVIQARGAEEVDSMGVAKMFNRPATSSGTPSSGMERRAARLGVAALSSEVVTTPVPTFVANGLSEHAYFAVADA